MTRNRTHKDLSLRWLELFQSAAQKGSLQAAADEAGLTVSTVSHHLRNLEEHLGVELFDHARRPMVLTAKGRVFLRNIDDALLAIRKARAEASAGNATDTSHLRIGSIEDFEGDIVPELAVYLRNSMPGCDFNYHTDASHQILELLKNRHLDLGITGIPETRAADLQHHPLMRDPYVLVLPLENDDRVMEIVEGRAGLPFLRFSRNLIIGRQIEAQLQRMRLSLPNRFECANSQTLMAMVAAGAGWAITTPLLYSRARRFHNRLKMHPFPGKNFARNLGIVTTPDCSQAVFELVDSKVRSLVEEFVLGPVWEQAPWLKESFVLTK